MPIVLCGPKTNKLPTCSRRLNPQDIIEVKEVHPDNHHGEVVKVLFICDPGANNNNLLPNLFACNFEPCPTGY